MNVHVFELLNEFLVRIFNVFHSFHKVRLKVPDKGDTVSPGNIKEYTEDVTLYKASTMI